MKSPQCRSKCIDKCSCFVLISKPVEAPDRSTAKPNSKPSSRGEAAEIKPLPAGGATDGARIIPVAGGGEEERFPWEERNDEGETTYFNPDTGNMITLPRGSGVVLPSPWIRVPNLGQTYLSAPAVQTWADTSPLEDHYVKHADDFGAKDVEDYAEKANEFYLEAESQGYRQKVDSNGTEYIYDPKTNTFGMYTIDGKTITFFKPTSNNYWAR